MHQFSFLFTDLKVVELATALAGPITGTFLKELGADVIKIEPPHGDVSRLWKNSFEAPENQSSIYYDATNGNKKQFNLDLKDGSDRQKLNELLKSIDIVITNLSDRKSRRLGLHYEQLRQIKSDVILANITGYDPFSDKPAFDMMIQADSGLLSMTGHPGGLPAKVPIPIADILASHQLREGILCALLKRLKTGEGSEIQVSLIDSMVSALVNQAGNYLMGQHTPEPMGTLHPGIAPYGDMFEAADRVWLLLAIGSDKQFASFCTVLNCKHWQKDIRYRENKNRVKHREALNKDIRDLIRMQSAAYWLDRFHKYEVPAVLIRNLQEVLEDSSIQHMIIEEMKPDYTIRRVKTIAFK